MVEWVQQLNEANLENYNSQTGSETFDGMGDSKRIFVDVIKHYGNEPGSSIGQLAESNLICQPTVAGKFLTMQG